MNTLYEYTTQSGETLSYEELRNASHFYRACLVAEYMLDNYDECNTMSLEDVVDLAYEVNDRITDDDRYGELENDTICEVLGK